MLVKNLSINTSCYVKEIIICSSLYEYENRILFVVIVIAVIACIAER